MTSPTCEAPIILKETTRTAERTSIVHSQNRGRAAPDLLLSSNVDVCADVEPHLRVETARLQTQHGLFRQDNNMHAACTSDKNVEGASASRWSPLRLGRQERS